MYPWTAAFSLMKFPISESGWETDHGKSATPQQVLAASFDIKVKILQMVSMAFSEWWLFPFFDLFTWFWRSKEKKGILVFGKYLHPLLLFDLTDKCLDPKGCRCYKSKQEPAFPANLNGFLGFGDETTSVSCHCVHSAPSDHGHAHPHCLSAAVGLPSLIPVDLSCDSPLLVLEVYSRGWLLWWVARTAGQQFCPKFSCGQIFIDLSPMAYTPPSLCKG